MENSFLAMLFRMKNIERWSLMHNTQAENLSEHSFECAVLAHFLANIGNAYYGGGYNADKLASAALYHDSSEILTGDLPTPVKYFNQEIKSAYKQIEALAAEKLLNYLPDDLRDIYRPYFTNESLTGEEKLLLKAADKLCAYIKCIKEINAGNREFVVAATALRGGLDSMDCNELKYFMDNCVNSFTMSLDELKGVL